MRGQLPRNALGQFVKSVELIHQKCPICGKEVFNYPSEELVFVAENAQINRLLKQYEVLHIIDIYERNLHAKNVERFLRIYLPQIGDIVTIPVQVKARYENNNGNRGKYNPNWKGGITPLLKGIRTSKEYKAWRRAVFNRDNYTCQECGSFDKYLHPHHIIPLSEDPSKAYDVDNGITLCIDCHQIEHPELTLTLKEVY